MPATLINVANAAMSPGRLSVMLKKALRRVADEKGQLTAAENVAWLERNAVDFEDVTRSIDSSLMDEAAAFGEQLRYSAKQKLATLGVTLGGAGFVELLYFVTRLRSPRCVVETGVAAGFSSQTILSAMERNGHGVLHSSDFPYFRLENPEQFVGVLVEERLKSRWNLHLNGDEANLPRILSDVRTIDLFHYDSDKSYAGRRRAMELVQSKCHEQTLVIHDDLQDGSFFHDYVTEQPVANYMVLGCQGKFVGIIGRLVS